MSRRYKYLTTCSTPKLFAILAEKGLVDFTFYHSSYSGTKYKGIYEVKEGNKKEGYTIYYAVGTDEFKWAGSGRYKWRYRQMAALTNEGWRFIQMELLEDLI